MELRNHPLMRYYGLQAWPPRWSPIEQPKNKIIAGEIGILKQVSYSSMAGYACHLYNEYDERKYMATVLIDDAAFCWHIYFVLHRHIGHSLAEIGSLNLSYIL